MKKILVLFVLIVIRMWTGCQNPAQPDSEAWISLFNGVNLDGWIPKISQYQVGENFGETFRVEDSSLVVRYHAYDTFNARYGHIFYQEPFSYYIIELDYRFTGTQVAGGEDWALRNSGIMVHGQPVESMQKDQDFPISIEVQLLGGLGQGPRTTANLCTPGTHVVMADTLLTQHCISSRSKTYDGDQWVHVRVEVYGDSLIRHVVEGDTVLQYSKPQIGGEVVHGFDPATKIDGQPLSSGTISLQSESHPVAFKNIRLLNLCGCTDPKAKNYKSYFLKPILQSCVY